MPSVPTQKLPRAAAIERAPIIFFVGVIVCCLGLAMLMPVTLEIQNNHEDYKVFLTCSAITILAGFTMVALGRGYKGNFRPKEVMIAVPLAWVVLSLFGSLPFIFSQLELSFTDAYFEAMSGLTATGVTVIVGLDGTPTGLLLWRFLLVWLGGFGIITFGRLVLPFLRVGGMQLFRLDLSARSGRIAPPMTTVIIQLGFVYCILTALCGTTFKLLGMSWFDAIGHAMATVSTGGFSSHDDNIGYFGSAWVEYAASFFMLIAAMPFWLHVLMVHGHFKAWFQDYQVRLFLAIVSLSIVAVFCWLAIAKLAPFNDSVRHATFTVVSLISTTGFSSHTYNQWGTFPPALFLLIMLIGGCSGSAAGGIKVFRLCILFRSLQVQFKHQVYPHIVTALAYNGEHVPEVVRVSVLNYCCVYMASFLLLSLLLSPVGLSLEESLTASAMVLGGVGPGFAPVIGPYGTFSLLPDGAKWLLVVGMLAGRLEIFILALPFTRIFWRA